MIDKLKDNLGINSDNKEIKEENKKLSQLNKLYLKQLDTYQKSNAESLNLSSNQQSNNQHKIQYQKYQKSEFYHTEHVRFKGQDDSVNWELDDKINAYSFVDKYGIYHPKIIAKFSDIGHIKELHEKNELPEKFVLKISNRHSCIGVMILRKVDDNLYFDDMSSNLYTIEEIIQEQLRIDSTKGYTLRDTYFFIEELLDNFVPELKIPFDYKVFCVNGIPKLILQINRNIYHDTIAFFDGNFIPLKEGRDWFINSEKAELCVPVIPPSAKEILLLSKKIAYEADKKLVRIDWFDTGKTAVFGEFTFCSGGFYTGMQSLSDEILENIDYSLNNQNSADYDAKGYSIDSEKLYEAMANNNLDYKNVLYNELLAKCVYGNPKAIAKMRDYFYDLSVKEEDPMKKRLYEHLMLCWQEIQLLYNDSTTERICKQVKAKVAFIKSGTDYFPERVREAKEALWELSKKSDWFKIRWAQFVLDFGGDENELKTCKKYVNEFAKKEMKYAMDVKRIYEIADD